MPAQVRICARLFKMDGAGADDAHSAGGIFGIDEFTASRSVACVGAADSPNVTIGSNTVKACMCCL
jgi:hypothetical protein